MVLRKAILALTFSVCVITAPCAVVLAEDVASANKSVKTSEVAAEVVKTSDATLTKAKQFSKTELSSALKRQESQLQHYAGKVAKGLLYCIGAIIVAVSLYKRFTPGDASNTNYINIIAKRLLGNRASLLVVEVEGKKLLLAQSGEHVTFLNELNTPGNFEGTLSTLLKDARLDDDAEKLFAQGGA